MQAIKAYIDSGEPMDKAGAYGIQGMGGSFVEKIEGCFFSVMGFPVHRFCKEVRAYPVFHVIPHTLGITAQAYELPHK